MPTRKEIKEKIKSLKSELSDLESEFEDAPADNTSIDVYLHGDKETLYERAEESGLTTDQTDKFLSTCYEVKITISVDADGNSKIVAVDDKAVSDKKYNLEEENGKSKNVG